MEAIGLYIFLTLSLFVNADILVHVAHFIKIDPIDNANMEWTKWNTFTWTAIFVICPKEKIYLFIKFYFKKLLHENE